MNANRNQMLHARIYSHDSRWMTAIMLCPHSKNVLIVTFSPFLSPAVPVFLLIACKAIYPYVLYQSALSSSCISSTSLILSLSIFPVAVIRPHCAGVAQTQNDKESPYLTSLLVEDLLFWAINRAYLLQGMQVSNLLVGCWRSIAPAVGWHVKQANTEHLISYSPFSPSARLG